MKELLISVTNFFRDPARFDALAVADHPRGSCRTRPAGSDPRLGARLRHRRRSVFDCDAARRAPGASRSSSRRSRCSRPTWTNQAIATAREGALHRRRSRRRVRGARCCSSSRASPAATGSGGTCARWCCSRTHNVIRDPPFSHLDLISCRNLLIYLNRPVQERLVETFHFALRPGGFLFLGASESPDGTAGPVHHGRQVRAHLREPDRSARRLALPLGRPDHAAVAAPGAAAPDARPVDRISPGELHQRLLERYAPPSMVVTEDHHVVHLSERVGRFLQMRGGEPIARPAAGWSGPSCGPTCAPRCTRRHGERPNVEITGVKALEDGERRVDICRPPGPARGRIRRAAFCS